MLQRHREDQNHWQHIHGGCGLSADHMFKGGGGEVKKYRCVSAGALVSDAATLSAVLEHRARTA